MKGRGLDLSFIRSQRPPRREASGVVACLDTSAYQTSVCDHAAWLAARIDGTVKLLHVVESGAQLEGPQCAPTDRARHPPDVLGHAASRLREVGCSPAELCVAEGGLAPAVAKASRGAAIVVIGRRGCDSEHVEDGFGANVAAVVRAAGAPVFVAAKVFLPLSEAMLIDDPLRPDPAHADRVATCRWLDGLKVSRVVADCAESRARLRSEPGSERRREVALRADETLGLRADLIVLPRSAFDGATGPIQGVAEALIRSPRSLLFC